MGLLKYIWSFPNNNILMQEDKKREVLPEHPAGSDLLSLQLYNEHRIDPAVRNQLVTQLTEQLDSTKKVTALVLGARCGLVTEILLPFCSHIDVVEEEQFAKVLEWRFVEGKEVDYFFGKEGFIGCRHAYPAPQLNGSTVRVIRAEALRTEGKAQYDLIVLQNPIITAQANLIEQLLATEHSLLLTMMVPGKITDPKLFRFFARFERQIIPTYYTVLGYQSIQNRRHVTVRRGEIIYYEVYSFKRKEGPPPTQQQLLELLGEEDSKEEGGQAHTNIYEGKTMVDTYLLFHYGPSYFGIENFPKACADVCVQEAKKRGIQGRALDLGCAVGRSTVDLAEYFNEVVGLDYSNAFIQAAQKVLEEKYAALTPKVKYVVGDACNLDKSLGKFNLIFGGNLIDRLPDPAAFLQSVSSFLQPNGLLILTSPYSWLAEFTPPAKWIGGIIENGIPVSTPQGLKRELLKSGLKECREEDNLRFVIKDNDWVYQYTLANVTFWLKE